MASRTLGILILALAGCGGGGGGVTGPPRITSVSPAPDSATGESPMAIAVQFNQAMNAQSIDDRTFLLTWSGGDGTFNDGNEVTIQALTLMMTSSSRVVFDLSSLPPIPDELYQLRLIGTGANPILSSRDEALDGEYTNSFPTGNMVEGGDFVMFFRTSTVVTSMVPAPGSVLTAAPASVIVRMPPDVDPATVNATTFRVIRSGGDGNFNDGDEVGLVAASITETAPGEYTFNLTGNPLPADTYLVTLAGRTAGGALRFDGVDDFVRVAAAPAFAPGTGSWTVECWVQVEDAMRPNSLVDCADADFANGWRVGMDTFFPFRFSVDGAGGTRHALAANAPTPLQWHHVAGVYDAALGETRIYTDGVLDANNMGGAVGAITPAADLRFGTFGFNTFLQGRLDDVRVWNVARTQAEIVRDMFRALTGNEADFVGYWNFDETFGQGIADLTFGNTGSLGADGGVAADDPVRISSDAWPQVMDLSGNVIDGTYQGTLPSGIGAPGADYAATFRIQ